MKILLEILAGTGTSLNISAPYHCFPHNLPPPAHTFMIIMPWKAKLVSVMYLQKNKSVFEQTYFKILWKSCIMT